jgi:oxygen-independent coproporphyrinogen-3 oxidase
MMSENRMYKPQSIYIHIPFCKRKCPYCDFYSVTSGEAPAGVSRAGGSRAVESIPAGVSQSCGLRADTIRPYDVNDYVNAVCRNLSDHTDHFFDTVYFGGGTPSVLPAECFKQMLGLIELGGNAEVTVEVNPDSATSKFLCSLRKAGVNRLSVGVQSLFDDDLKILGRLHNAEKAIDTIKKAKAAGFPYISADLMLALPNQTKERVAEEIKILDKLGVNHISAYLLKIENGTPFSLNTPADLPDDDFTADLYLFAVSKLEKYGFAQYEISNFAKEGCKSWHNSIYWKCGQYFGIGPGAHSYYGGKRYAVPRDIEAFIKAERQPIYITDENPGTESERIMLALRLTDTGIPYTPACDKFIAAGLMKRIQGNAALTPEGCLVSNSIIGDLADI